jgi:hypothetical protein
MTRSGTIILAIMALSFPIALPSSGAIAQEKQHLAFNTPAENSKYTEKTENLELGDVPDHILRVFEIRRTYPDNAPIINGIKIKESWVRGTGDRTNGIGPIIQYVEFVLENGDKIFARMDGIVESSSGKGTATIAGRITNGTGRFAAIQGTIREIAKFDIKVGFNENRTEIDYSVGK